MRLRHAPRPFRVAVWPAFLAVGLVFAADAPAGSRPSRQPPDQAATLARLHVSADRFVAQWRYAWEVSETYRHGTVVPLGGKSSVWDPPTGALPLRLSSEDSIAAALQWSASLPVGSPPRLIETLRTRLIACPAMTPSAVFDTVRLSDRSGRSLGTWTLCPSWIAGNGAPAWDERLDLDTAILAQFRPAIRAARAALLGALDSAGAAFPGSDWIVGQRVRFSLDQRDSARAVAAIESCSADAWWCLGLAGYVLSLQHQVPRADAVFSEMLTRMLPADRCAWSDLSEIIGADGQSAYARVSCDARDSLNARIWWLSDPLYVEIGNERRVEHYARKVLVALRSATGVNERWDMGAAGGGGAVAEMLVRYGWPTQSWWAGRPTDEARFNALGIVSRRAGDASDSLRAHGRFATAEYTEPRYHTVPAWRAIAHPDTAHEADWELTDQSNQASMATAQTWWPREDYDRAAGPMVQLFTQEGEFRRQNGVLLAIGFDLDPDDFPGASHDTLDGALVFTTGPDSMNASHTFGVVGFGNQISALVPSRSQVVSLELFGTHPAGVAARTRFGLNPPPSLAALKPGEIAIATPVLVRPPADDEAPPTTAEAALARLQGPVISDWTHVGFYWETYGLGGSDTVEITMRFEPTHDVALSQLGIRPLPGAPASGTVDFSWREPDPGHFVMGSSATGTVPIQGRNVTLDLSSLEPGEYRLTVGATKLHGPTVTASRPFWVVRDGVAGPSRSMIAGMGAQPVSGASPAPRAPDPGARYLASASRNRIDVRDTVVDIDVSGLPGAGPGGSGGNGGGVVLRLSYVDSTKGEIRLEGELSGAGRVQPISQVVPTARLKRITILASGGNGAGGVSGRPGQRGTPGRAGAGGCPVGSDGTDGGDGGSGTSGGAGGNGGHAGGIAVTTAPGQDELLALVTQTARPGYGGGGGAGGAGGAGGPGGPGGGGCRDGTGSAGSSGAPGSRGSDGLPGPPGNPGA